MILGDGIKTTCARSASTSVSLLLFLRRVREGRASYDILNCTHRKRTASSCAFYKQGAQLCLPSFLLFPLSVERRAW